MNADKKKALASGAPVKIALAVMIPSLVLAAIIVPRWGTRHEGTAAKKPVIALIMKSLANDFFQTMEQGAREHQKNNPDSYELIINGIKNESDISGQIRLVEHMIAQRVDAIVIAPADSKALISACAAAVSAGIVVVNIDNRLDGAILKEKGIRIPFVGPDNRKGARKVAEKLAERLAPGAAVAIIEGIPTAFNSRERAEGFREVFAERGLNVVASLPGDWDMAKANSIAASLIRKFPELRAIACANDVMALGARSAAKAAGKTPDNIAIAGFDNIAAVRSLLHEERIAATAEQYPERIAVAGILHALEAIRTKRPLDDKETPVDLIALDARGTAP